MSYNTNIGKIGFLSFLLLVLISVTVYCIIKAVRKHRNNQPKKIETLCAVFFGLLSTFVAVGLQVHISTEQALRPHLFQEITIPGVVKSIVVLLLMLLLVYIAVRRIIKCLQKHRDNLLTKSYIIGTVFCILISVFGVVIQANYVYPYERTLQPELIAELTVSEDYELEYPGQKYWHGAYEKFGLYAQSFNFDPGEKQSVYGFDWPEMDFKNHCYVITYGRTIKSLSYNVWEKINVPIRTGAYVGHMKLNDDFVPEKVYVYQLPKIRIENDINDVQSPWDWG